MGDVENPRGMFRTRTRLAEKLADVGIQTEKPRPSATAEKGLRLVDDADKERRQNGGEYYAKDIHDTKANTSSASTAIRIMRM